MSSVVSRRVLCVVAFGFASFGRAGGTLRIFEWIRAGTCFSKIGHFYKRTVETRVQSILYCREEEQADKARLNLW